MQITAFKDAHANSKKYVKKRSALSVSFHKNKSLFFFKNTVLYQGKDEKRETFDSSTML